MPISVDRIQADIEAITRFTESPGGADRPTFSAAWREARNYVIEQAKLAGCNVRIDAAGNVHARPEAVAWDAPVWLSGSHLDSVPLGGNYDGVAGVVAPLEVLRAAHDDNIIAPRLELMIFAEEEGTTFDVGMLGSRAWVGELSAQQLASVRNARGENYVEAGAACDVRPSLLIEDALNPRHYLGFVEVHIEQGPGLWNADVPLAVVTGIAGRKQYRVTLRGVANHAGSTSMADRKDALTAAAVCILQLEGLANGLGESTVITVGRIECRPNAINVIPAAVDFAIDFRSPSNDILSDGDPQIRQRIAQVCERRGIEHLIEQTEDAPAVQMDPDLCAKLARACADVADSTATAVSGALHDAAILAPHLPTAMLFVPSRDGISHNPAEFSRVEDIALATSVLRELVNET
ncbi:MAG TPA: M20 family metallo-hydrolase [Tepidisphaeraceae bacterium]|nr:M20 family metallo-hydrolase [Tepidisphaeraceae bacterium]